ncbi:DnaJ domain containing protein [Perkinsela sp. CCAP 1560/4]|nr:DnaJ domain containing protein [Perkinsela sp. CCAP 1560/4]|eukprot:KNH08752.1 DnaJ domain containing protein [Perkinsela sp. CCAP 1560/4]
MENDYYSILGISPEASIQDVEMAYRKAALKVHPDKLHQENSHIHRDATFGALSLIKNTLLSPTKREMYDKTRQIDWARSTGAVSEKVALGDIQGVPTCRCGGEYEFQDSELNSLFFHDTLSKDLLTEKKVDLPVLLYCVACSLVIEVVDYSCRFPSFSF